MIHFRNEDWYDKIPVMVSFPRCGSNWLQAVMEVYFNRHRTGKVAESPSWVDKTLNDNEPFWTHSHDQDKKLSFTTIKPVLYLWRDPIDVLFSLFSLPNGLSFNNPSDVKFQADRYGRHYKKWTEKAKRGEDVLLIKYEDLLENPHQQMEKISNLFSVPFNYEKSINAFETVGSKKRTNEKNGTNQLFKNKKSHTEQYVMEREAFKSKYGQLICEIAKVPSRYKEFK